MTDIEDDFNGIINRSFDVVERKLLSTTFDAYSTILPDARRLIFTSIPDRFLECPDDYLALSKLVVFGYGHYLDIWTINIHWDKLTEGKFSDL